MWYAVSTMKVGDLVRRRISPLVTNPEEVGIIIDTNFPWQCKVTWLRRPFTVYTISLDLLELV